LKDIILGGWFRLVELSLKSFHTNVGFISFFTLQLHTVTNYNSGVGGIVLPRLIEKALLMQIKASSFIKYSAKSL
jgi:hypothetical protein